MGMKQLDAHVKARKALARRVVARRHDWGLSPEMRKAFKQASKARGDAAVEALEARMLRAAYGAIAEYCGSEREGKGYWQQGWADKYGAYNPYTGAEKIGEFKDVPSDVVHAIMCRMDRWFKTEK
jgi:hypothetical protein